MESLLKDVWSTRRGVSPTDGAFCRLSKWACDLGSSGFIWYIVTCALAGGGKGKSANLLTLLHCPLLPQCLGLWLCPRRCASWKTTPPHFPSWRSTSSAVPRKALSMTTPSPVTMTGWPQCRHGEPRPATRYQAGGQLPPGASVHAAWLRWDVPRGTPLLMSWARSDGWCPSAAGVCGEVPDLRVHSPCPALQNSSEITIYTPVAGMLTWQPVIG